MRKKEELIDNYVEKIRKIYNSKHFVPLLGEIVNDLRNLLGELIDNNLDYLLTDSFLDYVCCGANFFGPLHNLNDNDYTRISILKDYFESIFLNEKTHIIQDYYDLLDDDIKLVVSNTVFGLTAVFNYHDISEREMFDIEDIIQIVLAYYLINNKNGNIDDMCNMFLYDLDRTLDVLRVNDIKDDVKGSIGERRKHLIDFVICKLDNNKNREIK